MLGGEIVRARQIGDGAGDLENAVIGARGEPEPAHRAGEEPGGIGRRCAPAARGPARHPGVDANIRAAEARGLTSSGGQHAGPDGGGGLLGGLRGELGDTHRGELEVQVDAIEQGARQPAEVLPALPFGADTVLEGAAGAPAGIGGGDELEARREDGGAGGPGDGDRALLQRLAKRFQCATRELG